MRVAMGKRNLLELMDAEDTTSITAVGTYFLTEARRDACVALRQLGLLNPFITMESSYGLFRSCDQVFLIDLLVFSLFAAFPNYLSG